MERILSSKFAYLMGNFMADGSFYISDRSPRFEFVDGSPYKKELNYCLQHMQKIKKILEKFLNKKLPPIRKKDKKFILKFRNKKLANLFINNFKLFPGKKHRTIDIPFIYKNSKYEKDFWRGYLDGDGSLARKSKKVSGESMSKKIIGSLADYLKKKNILFSQYKSKRGEDYSYVIVIRSVSFRDFAKKIGFEHPLKSILLKEKLKKGDFFVSNEIRSKVKKGNLIDYTKFFDDSVFVEGGKKLLLKYGFSKYSRENIRFRKLFSFLNESGLEKQEILNEINKFRFKKSKSSRNSVKLPLCFNQDIFKISKFVRIKAGGITFSKRYVQSYNEDFKKILNITQRIFDIEPKFTGKNEPLFCSGVISDFFNKIIKRKSN